MKRNEGFVTVDVWIAAYEQHVSVLGITRLKFSLHLRFKVAADSLHQVSSTEC